MPAGTAAIAKIVTGYIMCYSEWNFFRGGHNVLILCRWVKYVWQSKRSKCEVNIECERKPKECNVKVVNAR